jgi:hypothetical protein
VNAAKLGGKLGDHLQLVLQRDQKQGSSPFAAAGDDADAGAASEQAVLQLDDALSVTYESTRATATILFHEDFSQRVLQPLKAWVADAFATQQLLRRVTLAGDAVHELHNK